MTERDQSRSDRYQYMILETTMSTEAWNLYTMSQERCLPLSDQKKDFLLDLDDQLKIHFHTILHTSLTKHQVNVVLLIADGYTQMEVAKELDVNQSSVCKTLQGNTTYHNNRRQSYGGVKKKFARLIKTNMEIRPIMKKIHLIWEPNTIRLPHYQTFRSLLGTEEQFEKWLDE